MSDPRIIWFRPLHCHGERRFDPSLVLHTIRIQVQDPDEDLEPGPIASTFHLTPDGRWIEHVVELDPWLDATTETWREVEPHYVVQEAGLTEADLPTDLAALEPAQRAMRKVGPFSLHGPQSRMEPDEAAASNGNVVLRPNSGRNAWCHQQYVERPDKTITALRDEAKTKGWRMASDQAFLSAVKSHCKAMSIAKPTRKQPPIKQD